jgi:hypothetical protein
LGLSRNKVAVPEGAAGTSPFWSAPKKGTTTTKQAGEGAKKSPGDRRVAGDSKGRHPPSRLTELVLKIAALNPKEVQGCQAEQGRSKRQASPHESAMVQTIFDILEKKDKQSKVESNERTSEASNRKEVYNKTD